MVGVGGLKIIQNCVTSFMNDLIQVKIVDFGFARKIPTDADVELKVMCGTAEFISPEVLNFNPISLKSDIW